MRNLAKVRNLRLRLEQLEDRFQPSVGLFGDPLDADPLTGRVEDTTSDVQLVADANQSQDAGSVAQAVSSAPAQAATVQAPQAAQAAGQAVTLQNILNAGAGNSPVQIGKQGAIEATAVADGATFEATVSAPMVAPTPIDPQAFTLTRTVCGEEGPSAQDFAWSQYRGGAGIEINFRSDATDAGVVYSAGIGTDEVGGDNPGTITKRDGTTCTTAAIGTVDANFLILYGVNVSGGGGSVYAAGMDIFSGIAYLFKVDANLTTIEAGVQFPSAVALNFAFDVVNDAAGNRYMVGMTQTEAGQNGILAAKFDANLTLPPAYAIVVTFGESTSFGLSMDVDDAGNAYIGGGIVRAANDVQNTAIRVNTDGTLGWNNQGLGWWWGAGIPLGENGGSYGMSVQGSSVYITGIMADATVVTNDRLLIGKRAIADGTSQGAFGWGLVDGGDLQGYGIDVSSDNSPLVVGTVAGLEGDSDGTIIKFGTGLNTITGQDGIFNPTLDPNKDENLYGVSLIGSGASADFAISGDTNSDDLDPIINACTGEDTFGGIIDGYMGRYAQPLP